MPLSDFDRNNIAPILMQPGRFDSFSHHLLRLICKADAANREKFREHWPDEVEAVEAWKSSPMQTAGAR